MLYGIDIFSGAGGLSLGAQWAGINIKHAIEVQDSAARTFKRNHVNTNVIREDITNINPSSLKVEGEPIFIIMGGPPCQGFSLSNTRTRNMDNKKNFLFLEFVRFVRELRPSWFVLENVYGITNINQGQTQELIQSYFEDIGYRIHHKVLWASNYGVPQKRNRFFMVGNRLNIDFEFPNPCNYEVSVEEAIGDLPVLNNGDMIDELDYRLSVEEASPYAKQMRKNSKKAYQNYVSLNNELVIERYKYIGQGQNWRAIPDFLMQNYADKGRCHSGIYKRLVANKPSVVISNYRKSMLIHPYQDRGISVREAARLQSFPDDFIFEGPISHIQQQIGNAVPPLLAKAVFEQIIQIAREHGKR